eukprot:8190561-Pyramimonas_sp.AAC.1
MCACKCVLMLTARLNQTQEAWVYSHDGPTRRRKRGYIPTMDQLAGYTARVWRAQASVVIGELGPTLDDPDVYALDTLNSVLNGFGGRLFDQVRSQAGLAYT